MPRCKSSPSSSSASRTLSRKVRPQKGRARTSPRFTFDNFVVGSSNAYVEAVSRAVAERPGRIYNPLFFHGPPGLGKTHLLHAIGRAILYSGRKCVVRYVSCESFTNEFVEAIRKQTLSQFRAKYRKVDVLLLDDVQFLGGKDSTQEEFFHTFNDLFNSTKQIVLASDRAAADIPDLEKRLVSRFEWGLATQFMSPDLETRKAILGRKQQDYGVTMEPWVVDFIAERVKTDVRKLEGAMMRAAAHHSLHNGALTEEMLQEMLADIIEHEPGRAVSIDRIQRIVAEEFDIRMAEMVGRSRTKVIAEARQVAMYLTRDMVKLPLVEIGRNFGGRDHGTVIHACRVVKDRMDLESDFSRRVTDLRARIAGTQSSAD
jgi:chromosomal replication initiator protein